MNVWRFVHGRGIQAYPMTGNSGWGWCRPCEYRLYHVEPQCETLRISAVCFPAANNSRSKCSFDFTPKQQQYIKLLQGLAFATSLVKHITVYIHITQHLDGTARASLPQKPACSNMAHLRHTEGRSWHIVVVPRALSFCRERPFLHRGLFFPPKVPCVHHEEHD